MFPVLQKQCRSENDKSSVFNAPNIHDECRKFMIGGGRHLWSLDARGKTMPNKKQVLFNEEAFNRKMREQNAQGNKHQCIVKPKRRKESTAASRNTSSGGAGDSSAWKGKSTTAVSSCSVKSTSDAVTQPQSGSKKNSEFKPPCRSSTGTSDKSVGQSAALESKARTSCKSKTADETVTSSKTATRTTTCKDKHASTAPPGSTPSQATTSCKDKPANHVPAGLKPSQAASAKCSSGHFTEAASDVSQLSNWLGVENKEFERLPIYPPPANVARCSLALGLQPDGDFSIDKCLDQHRMCKYWQDVRETRLNSDVPFQLFARAATGNVNHQKEVATRNKNAMLQMKPWAYMWHQKDCEKVQR